MTPANLSNNDNGPGRGESRASNAAFERLCRLYRQAPHLKPMLFEALLHIELGLLIDPKQRYEEVEPGRLVVTPVCIHAPHRGIHEESSVLFTDFQHFRDFSPNAQLSCAAGVETRHLMSAVLTASEQWPMVIDPLTSHGFALTHHELRSWLHAWETSPLAANPFQHGGCEFEEVEVHSQFLMDRFCALFSVAPGVERAYLIEVRPLKSREPRRLALAIQCDDEASTERVRRALSLLKLGLKPEDAIAFLLPLQSHPRFERDVREHLQPVYDRGVASGRSSGWRWAQ